LKFGASQKPTAKAEDAEANGSGAKSTALKSSHGAFRDGADSTALYGKEASDEAHKD
jgi:hypothetical protein